MMKDLFERVDWSATSLGPRQQWPATLLAVYESLLASKAQVVIFAGADFVALYNDAYAGTIGTKHPAAFGRPAVEHWGELWDDLGPMLHHVRDTGETLSATDRPFYIERSGHPETVYFDISYSPLRGPGDEVCAVLCLVSETTRRVQAQATLSLREEQFRTLFSQANLGMLIATPEGGIIRGNARFLTMTGYDDAALVGQSYDDLLHPDDRPAAQAALTAMAEGRRGVTLEERLSCADGTLLWVSRSVGPVHDDAGQLRQLGMVVIDQTEPRRTEAEARRMAAIIASCDEAILSTDLDMRMTSWNGGAERLYGYSSQEVLGQPISLLMPDDRMDEPLHILNRIRAGDRIVPHETLRRHKLGHDIEVLLTASPIYDEHGEIIGVSKIARDFTQRRALERMQALLTAEMKHRVKNILATVHAIARQTFHGRQDAATEAFNARLYALSRAQDLVTRGRGDGAELSEIIAEVTAPYRAEQVEIEGPKLQLSDRAALTLTLGLHELATNAAKYGALSDDNGQVTIHWTITPGAARPGAEGADGAVLQLIWQETGGPPVTAPSTAGFGSLLIREVMASEMTGEVILEFRPEGLRCRVEATLSPDWGHPVPSPTSEQEVAYLP